MTYTYCTLFDAGFLNRGLALYRSLERHSPEPFRIFMLCVDDKAFELASKLSIPSAILIRLSEIENEQPDVKAARGNRSHREYCWTLGSVLTHYVMEKYSDSGMVIYLDSDLFFYSSPEPIYKLFEGHSTLIIPHRHPDRAKLKQQEADVGIYNVGMVIFRNDADGRACLKWWRDRTVEWCYDKVEPTRFGDQKYLDYFAEKFKGVYVLNQKGSNLAGWCIGNYTGKVRHADGITWIDGDELIFFHFSGFGIYFPHSSFLPDITPSGHYQFERLSILKKYIYNPYRDSLYAAMKEIRAIEPGFSLGTKPRPPIGTNLNSAISAAWWHIKAWLRPIFKPAAAPLP